MTDQTTQQEDIYAKKREAIKSVDLCTWKDYIQNKHYKPVLDILITGPKTIDEISALYPENEAETQKSDSTIYRYLKELEKAGLVTEVGRRISSKTTASKILYDRSARMFIITKPGLDIWSSERGDAVARTIGVMIKKHFNNKHPSISSLKNFLIKFESDVTKYLFELMQKIIRSEETDGDTKQIICELDSLDLNDSEFFILLSEIIWFIKQQDIDSIVTELGKCFVNEEYQETLSPASNAKFPDDRNTCVETNQQNHQDNNYQDIITHTPDLVQMIDEDTWNKYFGDYNYRAIGALILKSPRPIKEIYEKHHDTVLYMIEMYEKYETEKIKSKFLKKKGENTIYRYLKELEQLGVVTEAGRRITKGQSFTQILYRRKAFYIGKKGIPKDSEEWKKTVQTIGHVLRYQLQKKEINNEKLFSLLTNIKKSQEKVINDVFTKIKIDSIFEDLSKFDSKQHDAFNDTLAFLEWFITLENKKDLHNKLIDCFLS